MENVEISEEELKVFHKTVGENVKKIRAERNITQMELANAIGHESVAHIAKAELNKYGKKFNLEHIYKMSKVLKIPMSEFFIGIK